MKKYILFMFLGVTLFQKSIVCMNSDQMWANEKNRAFSKWVGDSLEKNASQDRIPYMLTEMCEKLKKEETKKKMRNNFDKYSHKRVEQ